MKEDLVVFILGTTGVGKSKLAIELAKEFDGEVISSDSMQLYKGGDIVTNKVTEGEMQGIPHHMMSFLENSTMDYNVSQFTNQVLPLIDGVIARGKVPIVVGGTHYYTLSILWDNTIVSESDEAGEEEEGVELDASEYTWEKLKSIDPSMAEKIHPNDIRKIKRAIDIYNTSGKKQSDIILGQTKTRSLRYRSCLVWLECTDDVVLEGRLNSRVDEMVDRGLYEEVFDLFKKGISPATTENFSRGVSQSIGVKELYSYYEAKEAGRGEKEITKLLKEAIGSIKQRTKRYAVKQTKWIKKLTQGSLLEVKRLDTTDLSKWRDDVSAPAKQLVKLYKEDLSQTGYQNGGDDKDREIKSSITNWKKYPCDVCNRVLNGEHEWKEHINSRKHKALLNPKTKRKFEIPKTNVVKVIDGLQSNNNNIQTEKDEEDEEELHKDQKIKIHINNSNELK